MKKQEEDLIVMRAILAAVKELVPSKTYILYYRNDQAGAIPPYDDEIMYIKYRHLNISLVPFLSFPLGDRVIVTGPLKEIEKFQEMVDEEWGGR